MVRKKREDVQMIGQKASKATINELVNMMNTMAEQLFRARTEELLQRKEHYEPQYDDDFPFFSVDDGSSSSDFEEPEVTLSQVYRDEPLIQTGTEFAKRKAKHTESDKKIAQMRKIARDFGWHSYYYGGGRLFYEQAKFMEDFSCDQPYTGLVFARFPTYEDLTDRQLKGYFTWRTHWRETHESRGSTTFLLMYAYEVLCGIGVSDHTEALEQLKLLRDACAETENASSLTEQIVRWMRDYAMYWDLASDALPKAQVQDGFVAAQLVARQAQEALLAADTKGTWVEGLPGAPTQDELLDALGTLGRNGIKRSKLLKNHRDELANVSAQVFAQLVDHCHHRRKQDFMESTFGNAVSRRYFPFQDAVFYDPDSEKQQARSYRFSDGSTFEYDGYAWYQKAPFKKQEPDKNLGALMQTIDRLLRMQLDIRPDLKERKVPIYQIKMINHAIDVYFAERYRRAALEKSRVRIDRKQLSHIRQAASTTRDALLVDEEREDFVAAPVVPAISQVAPAASTPATTFVCQASEKLDGKEVQQPSDTPELAPKQSTSGVGEKNNALGLSSNQLALLGSLLDDSYDERSFQSQGIMVALEVDAINDALFDLVGDTVIEYVDDQPKLVEDYVEDIKEALGL